MFRTALMLAVVAAAFAAAPVIVSGQDKPAAARAAKAAPAVAVNINTASAVELEALSGIGAAMAARIVEYRQKNGPSHGPAPSFRADGSR